MTKHWLDYYPEKEQERVAACRTYKEQLGALALPGHSLMFLVASMADQLDALQRSGTAPQPAPQQAQPKAPTPLHAARTAMATAHPAHPAPAQAQAQTHPPTQAQEQEGGGNYDPATEKQVKAVWGLLMGKMKLSGDDAKAHTVKLYGYPPDELSKQEASALIKQLQGQEDGGGAA